MKAPILLLAYNRPYEFGLTIESLANCDHCDEYELFVNFDAPNIYKKDDDSNKQIQIKSVLDKYKNYFRDTHIIEHRYHKGLANSVIDSVTELINRFGKIIVIEDDFLLSHDCLDYLDDALDYYETIDGIWSVTAYSAPLKSLKHYTKDVYLTHRPSSRVWGTWAGRWNDVKWDVLDYLRTGLNYESQLLFTRGGYDLPEGMNRQLLGLTDSWAIRWGFAAIKKGMMTVYPSQNRVRHIGVGGTHDIGDFEQADIRDCYKKCCFELAYDKRIASEWRNYNGFSYNQWRREYARGRYTDPDKYEGMFQIMHLWKQIASSDHNLSEYFVNRNYRTIAIYGKGRIGTHLENELRNTSVEILYYIDRNGIQGKIECFTPEQDLPSCDCIVITVVTDAETIRDVLRKKGFETVKTMTEVLRDA